MVKNCSQGKIIAKINRIGFFFLKVNGRLKKQKILYLTLGYHINTQKRGGHTQHTQLYIATHRLLS